MSAFAGASFRSYVVEDKKSREKNEKLAKAYERMYEIPNKEVEERLLPGEIAIGHAKKVIRYSVHDDPSRGISGTLVCTNFRLCFITAERSNFDQIELQNRLLSENDILLNNIESIFVEYPNKRKRLVPTSKVKDGIHRLELHCKDFRVAAFNFKLTVKGEEKGIIAAILHHAYPAQVSLLFAFDYKHDVDQNFDEGSEIPSFRNEEDWNRELRRCGVENNGWRVTALNRKYTESETMGAFFVVPSAIKESELMAASDQYVNNRLPMWCWADNNGCSLIRSAQLRPETELQYLEDEVLDMIEKADPQERPLKIIDLSKVCQSCQQLQQSFIKLKSLCMPSTETDFWETDARWYSSLQSTKWLQHISSTLASAKEIASLIRETETNVLVKETNAVDISPVITSLVQLILDPDCRTIKGFQRLIQKEWVVGGHPFLDRLGHLVQPKKNKPNAVPTTTAGEPTQLAPVFLLFLDCVWQLMNQYPGDFEASATFLTVLYDSSRMTAFDTFIFNNEKHRQKQKEQKILDNQNEENFSWNPLPIWCWECQYNRRDLALFNNPLYSLVKDHMKSSDEVNSFDMRAGDIAYLRNKTSGFANGIVLSSGNVFSDRTEDHMVEKTNKEKKGKFSPSKESKGRYPKVALMPKKKQQLTQEGDSDQTTPEVVPPARSKSDSDIGEEKEKGEVIQELDDVVLPLNQDTPTSAKLKSKWSIRRKKSKDSMVADVFGEDVSTREIQLQNVQNIERRCCFPPSSSLPLYPATNIPSLQLWRQCYFRWLPWCQISGGGPAAVFQQQYKLHDEIYTLQKKIQLLQRKLNNETSSLDGALHDEDDPLTDVSVFDGEQSLSTSSSQTSLNILSSYFPYTPIKNLRSKSFIGTPMSNFLQGGSLFNFGRIRTKHTRSPSDISISHSVAPSSEDISTATDSTGRSSRSLEDLTVDEMDGPTGMDKIRDRTQSDVNQIRQRLKLLDATVTKPRKMAMTPTTPTENITYITSL